MTKIVKVKKLFLNKYVSVRDYLVEEAMGNGEDLKIVFYDQTMTIKHKNLSQGRKDPKQNASKFNDRVYYLIDFIWKADKSKPKHTEQEVLF